MIDESQSATEGDGADAGACVVAGAGSNLGVGAASGLGAGVGAGSRSGAGTGAGSGSGVAAGLGSGARATVVAAVKVPKKVVRKRKMEDKMDGVLALMSQIHTDTNDRLK